MIFNDSMHIVKQAESELLTRWDEALGAYDDIQDHHTALTTAIVMENYLNYLNKDPKLIAEDKITTNSLQGVNLSLLGLMRRVIPEFIGLEIVGAQAMPTPRSPIFTLLWEYVNKKGLTNPKQQFNTTPYPNQLGHDPYYSSSQVRYEPVINTGTGDQLVGEIAGAMAHELGWGLTGSDQGDFESTFRPFITGASLYISAYQILDSDGKPIASGKVLQGNEVELERIYFPGNYYDENGQGETAVPGMIAGTPATEGYKADGTRTAITPIVITPGVTSVGNFLSGAVFNNGTKAIAFNNLVVADVDGVRYKINYEYSQESAENIPEIKFNILETTIKLIKRQIRGRYTLDADYDAKVLHGISLESEMMQMMRMEITSGMARETLDDLRSMAAIIHRLNLNPTSAQNNVAGNYDDTHKMILDAVSAMSAKIWTQGRLGYGNVVVGNPETLAFLDRVPGFVGSGVSADARGVSFSGSLGDRIRFLKDSQYPKNELLIAYKGKGSLDTGYHHCMYLPITASPTLYNYKSGEPSKIFHTRYGKTWSKFGGLNGGVNQSIDKGEYQYGRLFLHDLPQVLAL